MTAIGLFKYAIPKAYGNLNAQTATISGTASVESSNPIWDVDASSPEPAKIVNPAGEFTAPPTGTGKRHLTFSGGTTLDFTTGFSTDSGGNLEKTFTDFTPNLFVSYYSFRPGKYNLGGTGVTASNLSSVWGIDVSQTCELVPP